MEEEKEIYNTHPNSNDARDLIRYRYGKNEQEENKGRRRPQAKPGYRTWEAILKKIIIIINIPFVN